MVKDNKLFVFMKGTPDEPMCGFSRAVVQVLDMHGSIARKFASNSLLIKLSTGIDLDKLASFNILEDQTIREGVKKYS